MIYSLDVPLKRDDRLERTSCHYEDRVYGISDHAYPGYNVSQSGPNLGFKNHHPLRVLPISFRTLTTEPRDPFGHQNMLAGKPLGCFGADIWRTGAGLAATVIGVYISPAHDCCIEGLFL
jgi:hypothetical protein